MYTKLDHLTGQFAAYTFPDLLLFFFHRKIVVLL